MTALLLTLAALLVAALAGLAKAILTGEIRGQLSDRCHRRVERAAARLPPAIARDAADEWHAELSAFEDADRLISAWRFTQGLSLASRQIAGAMRPAPVKRGSSQAGQDLHGEHDALRRQLRRESRAMSVGIAIEALMLLTLLATIVALTLAMVN
jgi:hypothetical protein